MKMGLMVLLSFMVTGQDLTSLASNIMDDNVGNHSYILTELGPEHTEANRAGTNTDLTVTPSLLDAKGKYLPCKDSTFFRLICAKKAPYKKSAFAVQSPRLCSDPECKFPISSNFRMGQRVYYRLTLVGLARGSEVEAPAGTPDPRPLMGHQGPLLLKTIRGSARVEMSGYIDAPKEPGNYTLHFDFNDELAEARISFDAPLHVAAP
jgi:hypothetical protein